MLLQDLWAIENKTFDKLRDKYLADVRKAKPAERASITMRNWKIPRHLFLSAAERKMLQMSDVVQVTIQHSQPFTKRSFFLSIVNNSYKSSVILTIRKCVYI